MSAVRLSARRVAKPWGRHDLGGIFESVDDADEPVGEVWFEGAGDEAELLVKYIFTSERLSVQVHPNDDDARAAGYRRGKDEAWLILSAKETSRLALGLKHATTREAVAVAALDGSIMAMLDWQATSPGELVYNSAGTIHAIGADITLIEVQQNADVTYRLYDYGRPRELHLTDAVSVAHPGPAVQSPPPRTISAGRKLLCEGSKFVMERWSWDGEAQIAMPRDVPGWVIPISGEGRINGATVRPGECWLIRDRVKIAFERGSEALLAYPCRYALPLFER